MARETGRRLSRMVDRMEQRCLLPECAFRSEHVRSRSWLSEDTGECVGNIGPNRLPLRRPYVPSASELQPNDRANTAAKAVQVLVETERIGEQEALRLFVPAMLGRSCSPANPRACRSRTMSTSSEKRSMTL